MKTHAMNHGIWIRPALIVQLTTSFSVPVLLLRLLRNFFAQGTKKMICNAVVVTKSCWRNPFLACIISHSASLLLCLDMYNFLIYARLEIFFHMSGWKRKGPNPFIGTFDLFSIRIHSTILAQWRCLSFSLRSEAGILRFAARMFNQFEFSTH